METITAKTANLLSSLPPIHPTYPANENSLLSHKTDDLQNNKQRKQQVHYSSFKIIRCCAFVAAVLGGGSRNTRLGQFNRKALLPFASLTCITLGLLTPWGISAAIGSTLLIVAVSIVVNMLIVKLLDTTIEFAMRKEKGEDTSTCRYAMTMLFYTTMLLVLGSFGAFFLLPALGYTLPVLSASLSMLEMLSITAATTQAVHWPIQLCYQRGELLQNVTRVMNTDEQKCSSTTLDNELKMHNSMLAMLTPAFRKCKWHNKPVDELLMLYLNKMADKNLFNVGLVGVIPSLASLNEHWSLAEQFDPVVQTIQQQIQLAHPNQYEHKQKKLSQDIAQWIALNQSKPGFKLATELYRQLEGADQKMIRWDGAFHNQDNTNRSMLIVYNDTHVRYMVAGIQQIDQFNSQGKSEHNIYSTLRQCKDFLKNYYCGWGRKHYSETALQLERFKQAVAKFSRPCDSLSVGGMCEGAVKAFFAAASNKLPGFGLNPQCFGSGTVDHLVGKGKPFNTVDDLLHFMKSHFTIVNEVDKVNPNKEYKRFSLGHSITNYLPYSQRYVV